MQKQAVIFIIVITGTRGFSVFYELDTLNNNVTLS